MSSANPARADAHRDLPYLDGGGPRQQLDLYLPDRPARAPLVVWLHGGEFRRGDKRDHVPMWLLDAGYAVASVNYRLSGEAVFPTQLEDCRAAVRWLRARAAVYRIDPARIAVWGESAGGHLAALVGTTAAAPGFDAGGTPGISSAVLAVVDFFGPTDFLQMDAHRRPGDLAHDAPDSPESLVIGGPIQAHPEAVARANPITYVSPGAPPFLIVHGDADPLVPHHQSQLLADALRTCGVPVTFHTVKGGGHGRFADPEVRRLVEGFFAQAFAV
ncbi:MAG: alpha/beta hydrolase [Acidobacteriota bacterium]